MENHKLLHHNNAIKFCRAPSEESAHNTLIGLFVSYPLAGRDIRSF